jgi:GR25 family glycosyltransferase involved in LPS biosynthesis
MAFDRIYCISLAIRPDRYQRAVAEFQRVGLGGLVEFVIVDKHPTDSEEGIYASHLECLRAGLAAGAKRIVIFEDDVVFARFSIDRLDRAIHFMASETNWKIFFFGCFVNSIRKTKYRSVLKVDYRCTAHGYVLPRQFAEELVQIPWKGIPFDDVLRSLTAGQTYTIYPAFAFQGDSASDNDKLRRVITIRDLLGGIKRLQRWNEFSTRRLVPLIFAHVAAATLLALLLMRHFGVFGR